MHPSDHRHEPHDPAHGRILHGVGWRGGLDDGRLVVVDQTLLPGEVVHRELADLEAVRAAILALVVRGAPAIGIAAAYGLCFHLAAVARDAEPGTPSRVLLGPCEEGGARLASSRPTAVNLGAALARIRECLLRHLDHLTAREMSARLLMEAHRIHREDAQLCARIADHGAALLPAGGIYTHCNTGALATGGVGTALGCIIAAHRSGRAIQVYAGETRPLLQGARLTVPELIHAGVPVTLVCDSAAASLMARGLVQAVMVGADRIAANGDTANKIGTYGLAVLARHHGIPFYVAAPSTTFDPALPDGSGIVIEERPADEVRRPQGALFAPTDAAVANPAFDVTPAHLITAIVTERGVIDRPGPSAVARGMSGG